MDPRDRPATFSVRREPAPDPEVVGEDADIVERLRAEIEADGPLPFARFMERALYEPGHGYYRRPVPGPGTAAGDYLTAPEAHPIFGATIGRLIEQAWDALGRPEPFTITEPGAGTGALALGLLAGLRDLGSPLLAVLRYRPLEVEPLRLGVLRGRLAAEGLDGPLVDTPQDGPEAGAVVANEVLDALPVHRVVGRPGGLRELLVTWTEGGFAEVEAEPTTPALAARLAAEGVELADGRVAEVCLALDAWVAGATARLDPGVAVLIDYGEDARDLYRAGDARRAAGTLRAFARHAVSGDPFRHVGRQDLTAHVDLTAVRRAASAAGLVPLGETTQAELLARLGSGELARTSLTRPDAGLQDALALRSAVARLMDPRGMGGFRVLAFGRGLPGGTVLPGLVRVGRPGA